MHILFLSAWFPYPPDNGSKLRIYNLLRGLAGKHLVTLVSFSDRPQFEPARQLKDICHEVHVVPARAYNPGGLRALLGLFNPKPRVLVDRFVPAMFDCIRQEIDSGQYDLVVASQWYMAAYFDAFREVPAIFEEAEVGIFADKVTRAAIPLQRLRNRLTMLKMQAYFRRIMSHFAACTVVSQAERNLLKSMVPDYETVAVIPNGVNLSDYRDVLQDPEPETLIFTGSFRYFVNYEAMLWFLNEVFPTVKAKLPGVRVTITGDHAGQPLPDLRNVVLTGFVEDVRPLIASSWISLAPILTGGGTRLKILEAMALKSPVISTSKGAEGLDVRHEEHLLLADTPQAFGAAVLRLLNEPALRRRLVDNAYRLVREKYDWQVVLPQFLSLAEQVAQAAQVPLRH